MAGTPGGGDRRCSTQVWRPAKARAAARARGARRRWRSRAASAATIEPWDWRFYAEKVRQVRYALDEAEVKPYFPLERMVEAAFDCAAAPVRPAASSPRPDIAVYHPDVKVYEVRGADGAADRPLPARQLRAADQAQRRLDERATACSRSNGGDGDARCCRSSSTTTTSRRARPASRRCSASTTRARCSTSSATACTGCCRTCTYERLSGTSVLRDFVELPSQLFEHWLEEPEVLKRHARHHHTGEPIPDALIEQAAARRATSTRATRRCATPRRRWSTWRCTRRPSRAVDDVVAFERAELERIGLPRRRRPEPSPDALPAPVLGLGLRRRLLRLPVGRGARRRRLRGLRRSRRPVRCGGRASGCAASSTRRATRSSRARPIAPSAAAAPTLEPMLKQRGLVEEAAPPRRLARRRRRRVESPGSASSAP